MNRLLKRQVKRYLGGLDQVPDGWEKFLEAIGTAYEQADTDRRLLERTIELNSQELLQLNSQMRAAIPDTFLRIDKKQGIILDYKPGQNQNAYLSSTDKDGEVFGEVIGKSLQTFLPQKISELFFEAVELLADQRPEISLVHSMNGPQGNEYFYEVRLLPLLENQVVAIIRDITKREQAEATLKKSQLKLQDKTRHLATALADLKKTQAQLVQTEKMSGLGQLVAGIAHEINNPVNFVSGNIAHIQNHTTDLIRLLKLYQSHYPEPTKEIQAEAENIDLSFLLEDLNNIQNSMELGVDRISGIVRSLRTFSRLDESDMKAVDIHDGIESTLLILNHRFKATAGHTEIKIQKNYSELPQIECYAGQLNQVFMNVIANAVDALETPETVRDYASSSHPFVATLTIHTEPQNNNTILIRIVNNGPQIPEAIRHKLFDPFFTTKPIGTGTGLGLSISYQIIVDRHGGKMWCSSSPAQGTEFCIEIPVQQS